MRRPQLSAPRPAPCRMDRSRRAECGSGRWAERGRRTNKDANERRRPWQRRFSHRLRLSRLQRPPLEMLPLLLLLPPLPLLLPPPFPLLPPLPRHHSPPPPVPLLPSSPVPSRPPQPAAAHINSFSCCRPIPRPSSDSSGTHLAAHSPSCKHHLLMRCEACNRTTKQTSQHSTFRRSLPSSSSTAAIVHIRARSNSDGCIIEHPRALLSHSSLSSTFSCFPLSRC